MTALDPRNRVKYCPVIHGEGGDQVTPTSVAITIFTPGLGGGTSNTVAFSIRKRHRLLAPIFRH